MCGNIGGKFARWFGGGRLGTTGTSQKVTESSTNTFKQVRICCSMLLVLRKCINSLNRSVERSELWYFFISVERMASCWFTMILCFDPRSLYQADFCRIVCTSICGDAPNGGPLPVELDCCCCCCCCCASSCCCCCFSACRFLGSTLGPLLTGLAFTTDPTVVAAGATEEALPGGTRSAAGMEGGLLYSGDAPGVDPSGDLIPASLLVPSSASSSSL